MRPEAFFCITGRTCRVHLPALRDGIHFCAEKQHRACVRWTWNRLEAGLASQEQITPQMTKRTSDWNLFPMNMSRGGDTISYLICKLQHVALLRQCTVLAAFPILKSPRKRTESSWGDAYRHSLSASWVLLYNLGPVPKQKVYQRY